MFLFASAAYLVCVGYYSSKGAYTIVVRESTTQNTLFRPIKSWSLDDKEKVL